MWSRRKCSDQVHGMLLVWIRKDLITEHVRLTERFINKAVKAIKVVEAVKAAEPIKDEHTAS